MVLTAFSAPANAFEVKQKAAPDPALLERFEAERTAAQENIRLGQEKVEEGETMQREAVEMKRQAQKEANAELRRLGLIK